MDKDNILNQDLSQKLALELAEELGLEYRKKSKPEWVNMTWNLSQVGSENLSHESYTATNKLGTIHIEAKSPIAAAYAISQLHAGIASGHLAEFLGKRSPKFSLRPIGIGSLCIPLNLSQIEAKAVCRRVIELGYNAIFVGQVEPGPKDAGSTYFEDLEVFIKTAHEFGLKVAATLDVIDGAYENLNQVSQCPFNTAFRKELTSRLQYISKKAPSLDYLFWKSLSSHPDFTSDEAARSATFIEVVTEELKLVESSLLTKTGLIYFMPAKNLAAAKRQATMIPKLLDDAGLNTIVAFSAVAGNCFYEHLPPHPLWEELRKSPDISATRLMPIINAGMISLQMTSQAERSWPIIAADLIESFYHRLYRHNFTAPLILTSSLPKQGEIKDCNLWSLSQSLWQDNPASLFIETWFKAFCPDWDSHEHRSIMKDARHISTLLSSLACLKITEKDVKLTEEYRLKVESILANLKQLKIRAQNIADKQSAQQMSASLVGDVCIFFSDAGQIVSDFCHRFQLPCPSIIN